MATSFTSVTAVPNQPVSTVWTPTLQNVSNLTYDFRRFESSYVGQTVRNEVSSANLSVPGPLHSVDTNGQQALVAAQPLPSDIIPVQEAGLGSWVVGGLVLVGLWALNDQLNPVHLSVDTMNRFVARRLVKKAHGKLPKVGRSHRYDEMATRKLMSLSPHEMETLITLLKPTHYGMLQDVIHREVKASRHDPTHRALRVGHFLPLMKVLDERAAWDITCKVLLEIETEQPSPYCGGPKYPIAAMFKEFVRFAPKEKQELIAERLKSEIASLRGNNASETRSAYAEPLEAAYEGLGSE
jgi:hypothetical protein